MVASRRFTRSTLLVVLFCLGLLIPPALGQDQPDPLVDRERMWYAPTAEDWKRPCLITFQRNWEDAQAVSKETGKAILVCVNMDGEIASEHYAGIRYRDPKIAALYEPYVCVIASVYRHTPRDYDDQGGRILCPRFGSVTCGEHIAIESTLYERFFDGERVAPRHVGVELDGKEIYDVYYAFDTDSVFKAITDGIEGRPAPKPIVRGDRTLIEKVASHDIKDREEVEKAYQNGDRALRLKLLEAAAQNPDAAPVDLLRLALFGLDTEQMGDLGRSALAKTNSKEAVKLINEALSFQMESKDRTALIGALERLGDTSPRARMMATVHKGLNSRSGLIDVEAWSRASGHSDDSAAGKDSPVPAEDAELESRINNQGNIFESNDAAQYLELAEAFLASANEQSDADEEYVRCLFTDAQRTARKAEELGMYGWRLNAALCLTADYFGDKKEAYARAEAAVNLMPPGEQSPNALGVLSLFADSRRKAIADAVDGKKDWASWSKAFQGTEEWLTDLHAAYSTIARHPLAVDAQVVTHYDFLTLIKATGQALQVLEEGIARFPNSWPLHDRLRGRILRERGHEKLEEYYKDLLKKPDTPIHIEWYAGYAAIVAAEFDRRRGEVDEALTAYERAITHFDRWIDANADTRATADHYVALAIAGRARIALQREDYERALAELLASFERNPDAAGTLDGLNISPADTARTLLARLKEQNRNDLVERLEAALGKLDPELLKPPAYERGGPRRPGRGGRGTGRRGRPGQGG